SSDVCSSDLAPLGQVRQVLAERQGQGQGDEKRLSPGKALHRTSLVGVAVVYHLDAAVVQRQRVDAASEIGEQLVGAVDERRQRLGQDPRLEPIRPEVVRQSRRHRFLFLPPGDVRLQSPTLLAPLVDASQVGLGRGQGGGEPGGGRSGAL